MSDHPKSESTMLTISVCPTKISVRTEKKYKDRKMAEIITSFCALLNSNGGTILLRYERAPPKQHVVGCVRIIEQRLQEITTCSTVANLTLEVSPQQLIIHVKKSKQPVTMNYNLHLPSQSQVMSLPPTEPMKNIQELLENSEKPTDVPGINTYQKHFVKGELVCFWESKRVAVKYLKDGASKRVTLADRMINKTNKFVNYVSAFANHSGGHIHYGIDDNGTVEGEEVSERERRVITMKVSSTITKMIWPKRPERGKDWEIHFESVLDNNGVVIPSLYVIVIFIAKCPGGVFTEEPESYHIVDGRVEKMSFDQWKKYCASH